MCEKTNQLERFFGWLWNKKMWRKNKVSFVIAMSCHFTTALLLKQGSPTQFHLRATFGHWTSSPHNEDQKWWTNGIHYELHLLKYGNKVILFLKIFILLKQSLLDSDVTFFFSKMSLDFKKVTYYFRAF